MLNFSYGVGSPCRMTEEAGQAHTPFMQHGDTVEIEMLDENGNNVFGTICNRVNTQY